jgi:adenylate cyclase
VVNWRLATGRRAVVSMALALAVAGAVALVHGRHLLAGLQTATVDVLFKTREPRAARSTVIVAIDQRTYQRLLPEHGPLSHWPRTLYAQAIDALAGRGASGAPLASDGPRVIALTILFDGARPEDGRLAEAMRRAGNVVTPVIGHGALDLDPRPGVAQRFQAFVRPAPPVARAARAEGFANVTAAGDGVVRGLPLLLRAGDEELPSLALTLAALHARRPVVVDRRPQDGVVHAAGRAVPVGRSDTMAINYLGPPSTPGKGPVPLVSFVDVLDGAFDRTLVRDRIALIGPTIRGVDEHPTPTSAHTRMWGAEVLANAVETIVHQDYLVPAGTVPTLGTIALLALLAACLAALGSPWVGSALVLAVLAAYFTVGAVLFAAGTVVDLVHAPLALVGAFGLTLAHRVVFVERERRLVREAMGRYLSPSVGKWVLEDPRRLALGGELREMTVLFSDLRDFTTLAHALSPDALVALLNRYRSVMTDVVFAHDGVLVQYAGDATEAFWNAPRAQPDHAARACAAALEMVAALEPLREEFAQRGWRDLDIGVGVNTGRMVVGNMGSRDRIDYTAVGDAVNVAARLEGLTKTYGVRAVVGEDTRRAAGDAFAFRFVDVVAVKGRPEPLRVYEVMARTADGAEIAAFLERYDEAVALYRDRRWAAAEKLLADLAERHPGDGPTALYLARARAALADPPGPDWDAVYRPPTK